MSEVFRIELTGEDLKNKETMAEFQKVMDELHDANVKYVEELAQELNISVACANDVYYLRSRSRWTPDKETELIRLHREGNPPNMCEF